jgi:hypothetical protein
MHQRIINQAKTCQRRNVSLIVLRKARNFGHGEINGRKQPHVKHIRINADSANSRGSASASSGMGAKLSLYYRSK